MSVITSAPKPALRWVSCMSTAQCLLVERLQVSAVSLQNLAALHLQRLGDDAVFLREILFDEEEVPHSFVGLDALGVQLDLEAEEVPHPLVSDQSVPIRSIDTCLLYTSDAADDLTR